MFKTGQWVMAHGRLRKLAKVSDGAAQRVEVCEAQTVLAREAKDIEKRIERVNGAIEMGQAAGFVACQASRTGGSNGWCDVKGSCARRGSNPFTLNRNSTSVRDPRAIVV